MHLCEMLTCITACEKVWSNTVSVSSVCVYVHHTKSAHQCLNVHFHVTSHVSTLLSVLFRLVLGSFMLFVLYPTHSSRGEWQGNTCCSEWSKGDRVPAPGRETHPSLPAVLLGALPSTLGSQPPLLQSLCVQSDEASLQRCKYQGTSLLPSAVF